MKKIDYRSLCIAAGAALNVSLFGYLFGYVAYNEYKSTFPPKPADPTAANPEGTIHPPHLNWPHSGPFHSLDKASVRRGYEVYKQVCAACHSMKYRYFRHLSDPNNGFMTEAEAKKEAEETLIDDLDDKGHPIKRPGKLKDRFPEPYPNKKAAAAANGGSPPPDLTMIMLGRRPHGFLPRWSATSNDDYIFSILTGYFEAPAGVKVEEGKAYNPYFPGGVIAMPQQLFDDGIEYKDGTPATQSQQAKDICSFLRWSAEPYHDDRKKLALKILFAFPLVAVLLLYMKKHNWSYLKTTKVKFAIPKGREPPEKPKEPKSE